MTRSGTVALAALLALGCSAYGGNPYRPQSIFYLALSPDGRHLGALTLEGELRVYELGSRKVVFQPPTGRLPGLSRGRPIQSVVFQGPTRVVWDCRDGSMCWHDLASGEGGILFEHDPQDEVVAAISSVDGQRMAFGTLGGRVFTWDPRTGVQVTKKPKDIWTRGGAQPIYTLEGDRYLDHFLSASSYVGQVTPDSAFGEAMYLEVQTTAPDRHTYLQARYEGITVWPWGEGKPVVIDDGFSGRVQADFSADGTKLVIKQEGGSSFFVYDQAGSRRLHDLTEHKYWFSMDGLRFLDTAGRFIGSTDYQSKEISIVDTGAPGNPVIKLRLRVRPGGGKRMMLAYPEKGWIFIGLRDGGVDWYEFLPSARPRLKHLATLR